MNLGGKSGYTPISMSYPTTSITKVKNPQVISKRPIYKAFWLMGLTAEQALAINVKRKGMVADINKLNTIEKEM